jgi:hypothetical protein
MWRLEVPNGLVGWVSVEFEVRDAAPLPADKGTFVVTVPASGTVQTSTAFHGTERPTERVYVDAKARCSASGRRFGATFMDRNTGRWKWWDFVGTEQDESDGWTYDSREHPVPILRPSRHGTGCVRGSGR